jgi:hypothetical protein
MSMSSIIELVPYLMAFSLIFAVIAIFISIYNWIRWKKIEPKTMKARVFLDKKFLDTNFKLTLITVMIIGGLLSLHSIMEYFELVGIDFKGFYIYYYSLLPVATACLMLMAFMWSKLLNMKFKH